MAKVKKSFEQPRLLSKWGGEIVMKTVFLNGKLTHHAECTKTGKTARKPRDLM